MIGKLANSYQRDLHLTLCRDNYTEKEIEYIQKTFVESYWILHRVQQGTASEANCAIRGGHLQCL